MSSFDADEYEYQLVDSFPTQFQRRLGRSEHMMGKHEPIKLKQNLSAIQQYKTPDHMTITDKHKKVSLAEPKIDKSKAGKYNY
jgi:hypothetical protein